MKTKSKDNLYVDFLSFNQGKEKSTGRTKQLMYPILIKAKSKAQAIRDSRKEIRKFKKSRKGITKSFAPSPKKVKDFKEAKKEMRRYGFKKITMKEIRQKSNWK